MQGEGNFSHGTKLELILNQGEVENVCKIEFSSERGKTEGKIIANGILLQEGDIYFRWVKTSDGWQNERDATSDFTIRSGSFGEYYGGYKVLKETLAVGSMQNLNEDAEFLLKKALKIPLEGTNAWIANLSERIKRGILNYSWHQYSFVAKREGLKLSATSDGYVAIWKNSTQVFEEEKSSYEFIDLIEKFFQRRASERDIIGFIEEKINPERNGFLKKILKRR